MSELLTKDAFNEPLASMRPAPAVCLKGEEPVSLALQTMIEKKIGSLLVLDEHDKLSGIVTERDMLMRVGKVHADLDKLPIKNIMTPSPLTLTSNSVVKQALEHCVKREFRHIPVSSGEGPHSMCIISARDILRYIVECFPDSVGSFGSTTAEMILVDDAHDEAFEKDLQDAEGHYLSGAVFSLPLNKIISKMPVIMNPTDTIDLAYDRMVKEKVEAVLIVEYDTKVIGILTERDFLTKVIGRPLWNTGLALTEFMSKGPVSLLPKHKIAHGINNMFKYRHRHIVMVDEEKCPLGPISVLEILHFIYHRIFPPGS